VKILVTGAAGFLGRRVIAALLGQSDAPVTRVIAADLTRYPIADPRVDPRVGAVEDESFVRSLVERDVDVVYHLAAALSGQSEAEFEVGMRVNIDGTRRLLEACRLSARPPRVVFSSTIAALGGPLPAVVPETQMVEPESSYGAEKAICELLVSEYSRRGFVDGVSCRVPTVAIRPGKPNSALSSFVSGIVREPLAGVDAICPVPLETRVWISSPDAATRNLVHAGRVAAASLGGRRTVNLPGLSVTPREMLDSLERLAGRDVRARVRVEVDPRTARIVGTWPGAFDVTRALSLGFTADRDIDAVIRQFMAEAT
jgi:nucleoside-diphosphate-sugar epimerase